MVLFYLDRIDNLSAVAKLPRPISDYFRTNVFVTPGGVFSQRYLRWATDNDRTRIASGNWDGLCAGIRR